MKSFLANILAALFLLIGLFWYVLSQNEQDIATLASRNGVVAPQAQFAETPAQPVNLSVPEPVPTPTPTPAPTTDDAAPAPQISTTPAP